MSFIHDEDFSCTDVGAHKESGDDLKQPTRGSRIDERIR
jgi:hypothetical protein